MAALGSIAIVPGTSLAIAGVNNEFRAQIPVQPPVVSDFRFIEDADGVLVCVCARP